MEPTRFRDPPRPLAGPETRQGRSCAPFFPAVVTARRDCVFVRTRASSGSPRANSSSPNPAVSLAFPCPFCSSTALADPPQQASDEPLDEVAAAFCRSRSFPSGGFQSGEVLASSPHTSARARSATAAGAQTPAPSQAQLDAVSSVGGQSRRLNLQVQLNLVVSSQNPTVAFSYHQSKPVPVATRAALAKPQPEFESPVRRRGAFLAYFVSLHS